MQAAILRVKLQHLADDNAKRKAILLRYNQAFQDLFIFLPAFSEDELHAMHLYVIKHEQRDELLKHLRSKGVGACLRYPLAAHQHTAYANRIRVGTELTKTGQFYQKNLPLPMFHELSDYCVEKVISAVQKFF